LGGGWLTTHVSMRSNFLLAGALTLLIVVSAVWARESDVEQAPKKGAAGLAVLLTHRKFWALSAFIFLWSFYPFLGTAQFYYQSDALKLTPQFIGFLNTLGGVAGALGAVAYGRLVGKVFSTAALVRAAVVLGAPLALGYLFFLGPWSTAAATFVVGFFSVGFRLAVMDLAAQSCPEWAEATAFAAYMAVFNLAASASNTVGGNGYDWLRSGPAHFTAYGAAAALIAVGGLCTAACWPLLRFVLD
jgi:predicted MFS family arabinose efflux permease